MSFKVKAGIGIVVLGIVLAVVVIALFIQSIRTGGVPDYNADVVLEGLSDEVTVYRDGYGVPHLYAKNEDDVAKAVGYCMAQDRLWQMDLLRRVTQGRLSEILGADLVDTDHFLRALGIPQKSRWVLSRTRPEMIRALEAFSDGVNQYIEQSMSDLPTEFRILGYKPEKWKPEHSVNIAGYMAFDLSTGWGSEVLLFKLKNILDEERYSELLPDVAAVESAVYPEFSEETAALEPYIDLSSHRKKLADLGLNVFHGSNNWAVSGDKTDSGKPILANDMHLGLSAPGIWTQMHMVVEGELNVTGVVLPGAPAVVCGHNEHIAWGFTNVMVDDMDFYLEKINPENPNEYEFEGEWREIRVVEEKIRIKGGETVKRDIRYTHRGPIISGFKNVKDKAISMRWTGNEYSNELRTVYLLNRAENWDDFTDAIKTFRSVCQNVVYADVEGNIGLYCAAGAPIRESNQGVTIFPGWTGEHDWQGFVPFEELPHEYNPESGSVSSANNKTAGNDYSYYISLWFDRPDRVERIREMLSQMKTCSVDDFKRMQADRHSRLCDTMKEGIVAEVSKDENLSPLEKKALGILKNWDGNMETTSIGASVFEAFYARFTDNTLSDEMGEDLYREYRAFDMLPTYAVDNLWKKRDSAWFDDVRTEGVRETFSDIVLRSFKCAVTYLDDNYGGDPDKWQWGRIHTLTLKHGMGSVAILDMLFDLNRGPYPVGGSFNTVCPFSYDFNDRFKVNHGASHRHIFPTEDWDKSLTVLPTGVSGVPASDHYCDQTALYLKNEYHSDYFSRDLVEKNAKYKMVLKGK